MATNYIPNKDADFDNWLDNFSSLITAAPAVYGLIAADAVIIAAQQVAFEVAYTAAINPATRTPQTVQAKDTAKANSLAVVRPYSQRIANNAGVSSANKIALGLNPRTNSPTPVPAPNTTPDLTVQGVSSAGVILRYRDSVAAPKIKAKPFGATALDLRVVAGSGTPTATVDVSSPTAGLFTKSPMMINTGTATAGTVLNFAGRWVTRKGLAGAFGPVVQATVQP